MLIKLKKGGKVAEYNPPVEVVRHFDDIDTESPATDQIEKLLWIPASIVARFLGQFPFLRNETDELFSIGCTIVAKTVSESKFSGDKIGAVCNVRCIRAMEDYVNGINSMVKVCTTTRYENLKNGIETPVHTSLTSCMGVEDDHTEVMVRDVCERLGYDRDNLTLKQKRRVWEELS